MGTKIEIIGSKIGGRSASRPRSLGGLQGRLDDAGDTDRDLVLQIEDVLERAIEAVGPQMHSCFGLDKLRGNANPPAALPDRAFEDVAHAQLAADPLYVDRLALVCERAVACDHEQPADAAERGDDLLNHAVGKIFLL